MQLTLPAAPSPATYVPTVQLLYGDCLEVMPTLAASSVSMVFADLPYGVTSCSWDTCLDISKFNQASRTCLSGKAQEIYTATQPFASVLIAAMISRFRYDIVWQRKRPTGFFGAKKAPLREHEHVLIFGSKQGTYNPIMKNGKTYCVTTKNRTSEFYGTKNYGADNTHKGAKRYPRSVINVEEDDLRNDRLNGRTERRMHPTQKPVALLEWLIRTYTNEGDTVLDPVSGSATTAIAALRTGRNVICIEKDPAYFEVGRQRVAAEQARLGHPVTV